MKKCTAHYKLEDIKAAVKREGRSAFTHTAVQGVQCMGLSFDDAVNVILSLSQQMLYKSMTTYSDHKVWQDVYHAPCPNGKTAYIKVTKQQGAVVIQFKEK